MNEMYPQRTLTAFFEKREAAEDAVASLREIVGPDGSVRLVGRGQPHQEEKGFWDSLSDMFFPDDDRETYAEGLERGGYLVVAENVKAENYDLTLEILDREGSVDVDQLATGWRSEGWTGSRAGDRSGRTSSAATSAIASSSELSSANEQTIPVIEEEIKVGKRDVDLGRVRVRSYVVETPVSQEVNLREERVHVERRPVDRGVVDADMAFTDKVIEVDQHAEEAVVSKQARVTEEISLRREDSQRTETVSDTVRRTEVEIEDERETGLSDETSRDTTRRG